MFYQGDVWLDGEYLGDTEGYFVPHVFEVTGPLHERTEHLLAIELACTRPEDRRAKRNLTGVFQHWDCADPDFNPGGIWRPVRIERSGSIRIAGLRALCTDAGAEGASLEIRAVLDASNACTATIRTALRPAATDPADPGSQPEVAALEAEQPVASGVNTVAWRLGVEQPALWWPHALGDRPLYDLTVEVVRDGVVTDARTVRTGLRQVRMRDFVMTVNGERMFLKGTNVGPTRMALADATPYELERDIVLARDAGLDLVRVHAHVSRPELYDAADRHGMLLWQDMPLQWGYAGVRRQAARQARAAVELLGHHPSIAIWCGHNSPIPLETPGELLSGAPRDLARYVAGQALPTRNKTALDGSVRRALSRADHSRPVVAHSGVLPHPAWGTDSHLFFGWYHGAERDLSATLARIPVLARFVSEFGAQAVPMNADFMEPERWPNLDWERLGRAHCLQKAVFDRRVPPAQYPSLATWRDATQQYQATLIRRHVETLRRLKYRPAGGFCQFLFADSQAAVSWSVLDHERAPKLGFEALAAACAPVIVVADRPEPTYTPGDHVGLDVHAVSDLRHPVAAALARARLRWPGGDRTWSWEGDLPADSCVRIGRIEASIPHVVAEGPILVELDLEWSGGKADNRYSSRVVGRAMAGLQPPGAEP
jgi:beta-mannosidase